MIGLNLDDRRADGLDRLRDGARVRVEQGVVVRVRRPIEGSRAIVTRAIPARGSPDRVGDPRTAGLLDGDRADHARVNRAVVHEVPAVPSVTLAVPPGWRTGVVKFPLSAFASCGATSLLTNVTTVPTVTVTGLGENAVLVRPKAPLTMLILCVAPAGGVGVGVGGVGVAGAGVELPHAAKLSPATRTRAYRSDMPGSGCKAVAHRDRRFPACFESGNGKELSRS